MGSEGGVKDQSWKKRRDDSDPKAKKLSLSQGSEVCSRPLGDQDADAKDQKDCSRERRLREKRLLTLPRLPEIQHTSGHPPTLGQDG